MEQRVEHGAAGAAGDRTGRVAIEAVLADIEEERRQILVAEIAQRADIRVEIEILDRLRQDRIDRTKARQHIAFEFGHVRHRQALGLVKPFERTQKIAERVAQFAILVGNAGQDFLADAVVFGEIDRQRPQPQDVRAIIAHQVDRADRVAQRFGHFHALGIHREAVSQHRLVRRSPSRRAGFEQRRLEPAAMLVRPFEIEIGDRVGIAFGAHQIRPAPAFQHEGMGRTRIKPHIENVGDTFVIVHRVIGAQIFGGARLFPGIDAFFGDRRHDPRIHRRIDQHIASVAMHKQRQRHAPGALARQHPVGAAFDHGTDAVAAFFGHKRGGLDRRHRAFAQSARGQHRVEIVRACRQDRRDLFVHRHEPLRRAAKDHFGL